MGDDTHVADIRGSVHETTHLVCVYNKWIRQGSLCFSRHSPTVKLLLHGISAITSKLVEGGTHTMAVNFQGGKYFEISSDALRLANIRV